MLLPIQKNIFKKIITTSTFKGLSNTEYVPDGMFTNLKNISFNRFPVLSSRKKRGIGSNIGSVTAMEGNNNLYYVSNNQLVTKFGTVNLPLANVKRQIVIMGGNVFVFPDKVYINITEKNVPLHYMENIFDNINATKIAVFKVPFDFDWSKNRHLGVVGSDPDNSAPQACGEPNVGDIILSTYSTPTTLYECVSVNENYSSTRWAEINNYYLAVFAYDNAEKSIPIEGYEIGDVVNISGIENAEIEGHYYVEDNIIRKKVVGNTTEYHKGIIINCKIASDSLGRKSTNPVTNYFTGNKFKVARTVPNMDFVTAHNGRLWGCSNEKHEIYSSALSAPCVWQDYGANSYSSFALSVPGDGDFTGAFVYREYVMFFKEMSIYKIYGTKPANYTLTTDNIPAVEKGAEKSVQIVNGKMYYKSKNGVYCYNGTNGDLVSKAFGNIQYFGGNAGVLNNCYYLCTKDAANKYLLFVLDTEKGIWTKEDNIKIDFFANKNGTLYFLSENILYAPEGATQNTATENITVEEPDFNWLLETGDITVGSTFKKHFSKIQLRLQLENNAFANVFIKGNEDTTWQQAYNLQALKKRVITVPIIPKRCDSIKIKVEGTGEFKLLAIAKTVEKGSEY